MAAVANGFQLTDRPAPIRQIAADLWHSRDLVVMLARKDFVARFRRATIGMAWAVGLPLIQAVVLAAVFSAVARVKTPGVNYPTFVYTGTLAWSFFSGTITGASTAIVDQAGMASKIYFPRAVLPIVTVVSNVFAFLPSMVLLIVFALAFGVPLGLHTFLLIPAALTLIALASSFALVAAALHVYFRDMRYIVQAAVLPWFWASAVFFPLSYLHHGVLKTLILLNPATGVIVLFRAAIVGADRGWTAALPSCYAFIGVLFAAAILLYRRFDRVFVDLL